MTNSLPMFHFDCIKRISLLMAPVKFPFTWSHFLNVASLCVSPFSTGAPAKDELFSPWSCQLAFPAMTFRLFRLVIQIWAKHMLCCQLINLLVSSFSPRDPVLGETHPLPAQKYRQHTSASCQRRNPPWKSVILPWKGVILPWKKHPLLSSRCFLMSTRSIFPGITIPKISIPKISIPRTTIPRSQFPRSQFPGPQFPGPQFQESQFSDHNLPGYIIRLHSVISDYIPVVSGYIQHIRLHPVVSGYIQLFPVTSSYFPPMPQLPGGSCLDSLWWWRPHEQPYTSPHTQEY